VTCSAACPPCLYTPQLPPRRGQDTCSHSAAGGRGLLVDAPQPPRTCSRTVALAVGCDGSWWRVQPAPAAVCLYMLLLPACLALMLHSSRPVGGRTPAALVLQVDVACDVPQQTTHLLSREALAVGCDGSWWWVQPACRSLFACLLCCLPALPLHPTAAAPERSGHLQPQCCRWTWLVGRHTTTPTHLFSNGSPGCWV
jgi:hypothetical protein